MESFQINSAYIVHTQIIGLGAKPFPSTINIRTVWRPLFESKSCFYDLRTSIQDVWRDAPLPSKPFIRNLSSVCFNTRSIRLTCSLGRTLFAEHLGRREEYWDPEARLPSNLAIDAFSDPDAEVFGYDQNLEDQRMNYLYYETYKPLSLRTLTNNGTVVEAKVFIHIFPSGYVSLQLAVPYASCRNCTLSKLRQFILESRPWRTENRWIWFSRVGNGKLNELIKMVTENLQHSLYINAPNHLRRGQWHSSLKLVSNAEANKVADVIIQSKGHYDVLEVAGNSSVKYLISSKQGLVCVVRPGYLVTPINNVRNVHQWHSKRKSALRYFWKCMAIVEFVAFKNRVYDDYIKFLSREVQILKEFRLSPTRKMTKENLLRFSVYDHKIPQFLSSLDSFIKYATPYHRRIYSLISTSMSFNQTRDKLLKIVNEWEEEIENWEPSLSLIWKKIISPLRSLLT